MPRQPITAYLIRSRVATEIGRAAEALEPDGTWTEAALQKVPGEGARLFVTTVEPSPPAWRDFLEEGTVAELPLPVGAANGAVAIVQARETRTRSRLIAFTFGQGRFLLRPDALEHRFGLRVALNVTYPRGTPVEELTRLRSVDAKTIDEVSISTRRQASRTVSIDIFGLNVRRDLLRGVIGKPVDAYWGNTVAGSDSFRCSVHLSFTQLGESAEKMLRAYRATDYRERFSWIDFIQPVRDASLIDDLQEALVTAVLQEAIDLVGPEGLDLDRVAYYRFTRDRSVKRDELRLRDYIAHVGPETLDIDRLRHDLVRAFDSDGDHVGHATVYACLTGELTRGGRTYVVADGLFYLVEHDYLEQLNADVRAIPTYTTNLPPYDPALKEGGYNELAARSRDFLLLDKRLIALPSRGSAIEPCDLYSRNGAFVHVKVKERSSTLSHLFSQGSVAGELFVADREFRSKLHEILTTLENERTHADQQFRAGFAETVDLNAPEPNRHEVVFAMLGGWRGRDIVNGLPFFSRVNLRQRVDELTRLGLRVSVALVPNA